MIPIQKGRSFAQSRCRPILEYPLRIPGLTRLVGVGIQFARSRLPKIVPHALLGLLKRARPVRNRHRVVGVSL